MNFNSFREFVDWLLAKSKDNQVLVMLLGITIGLIWYHLKTVSNLDDLITNCQEERLRNYEEQIETWRGKFELLYDMTRDIKREQTTLKKQINK